MNIITCIKQVPASSEVAVDPKTGVLIRDGNNVKMNPYDLYAIEAACQIKASTIDGNIHAITMGPPAAMSVLKEALYMGADEATLVSDRRFAGADVLATAYTLSQLIHHLGSYDLIVCGKQTTDGDTAQVGPEIAECLGIPHVSYVKEVIAIDKTMIRVVSSHDAYDEVVEVLLPCLITIEKGFAVPRLPSFRRRRKLDDVPINTITLGHLEDPDPAHYGLEGSPTQVEKIFPPEKRTGSIKLEGTRDKLAQDILNILKEGKHL